MALDGAPRSGDLQVVEPFDGGVLVGVVDGLGHGDEAAEAAAAAADILSSHASEPVVSLVRRCHEGLKQTRGAAMSLASFAEGDRTVSWIGVGNVEASLIRAGNGPRHLRESLVLRGGVVGYRLPRLLPSFLPVGEGDVLILATDGVVLGSIDGVRMSAPAEAIAEEIVSRFARGTDDALALVVRYRGKHS